MSQSSYFTDIGNSLVKVVSEVLKEDYCVVSMDEFSSDGICVYFKVAGDINGDFCIVFRQPLAASRQFLLITVGDSEAAAVEESCQEIANQITGRILGYLSENGAEIEISYPGTIGPANEAIEPLAVASGACGHIGLALIGEAAAPVKKTSLPDITESLSPEEAAKKPRVLIVDDSPVMCAFLEKIFLENGFEVAGKAADGVEALDMFEKVDPDVVTLDIVMPKLKGTEVLQKILQIRPDAAVVMASSVSDARTVMSCLKMGAKRYIIKPYDKKAVIGAVEKALGLNTGV